jgi:hypothetical protein
MSIYSRLYNTLPREGHSQRENFLTEAFADLMNRLERVSAADARRFIVEALMARTAVKRPTAAIALRLKGANHVRWDTQRSIRLDDSRKLRKRPDILISIDGECGLLVEVKLTAPFTSRTLHAVEAPPSEPDEVFYQLDDYGKWLFRNHPAGGLVLLTHAREAPADFLIADGDNRYGVKLRALSRWREVYKWLEKWTRNTTGDADVERLAREFLEFLREEGMSEVKDTDLAILNGLLSFSQRMKDQKIDDKLAEAMLFARGVVHKWIPPRAGDGMPKRGPELDTSVSSSFYDYSCPYPDKGGEGLSAGWGFSPAENPSFFPGLNLPSKRLQAFFYVGGRALRDIRKTQGERYRAWAPAENDRDYWWIRYIDAVELANSEKGFTLAFADWLHPLAKEGAEILAAASKTVSTKA